MLLPPALLFLAKDPIVDKYDLSSLELVITGGASAGKDLIEEVCKRLPNIKYIVQAYGMTEATCTHLPILNNIQHASVGKLVSNLEQKIIDLETGNELPIGQIGEICIKSPANMMGYFNNPMATEECLDSENWYKTGDIGYLDEEGFLYVVERKKELIKVAGFQVAPTELEDVLMSKSDVRDCAVIGVPDEIKGEVPKAFIVKKNPNLTEQQVIEYVKEKLSSYKWLQGGVEFVQEIPKAPSGKVLRRILRDRERNKSMLDVLGM
uniref:Uncharacterized protein n=1 Tax=Acrobeloides nanus TaxID=290746 RepID=A0A914BUT6_9BILA